MRGHLFLACVPCDDCGGEGRVGLGYDHPARTPWEPGDEAWCRCSTCDATGWLAVEMTGDDGWQDVPLPDVVAPPALPRAA